MGIRLAQPRTTAMRRLSGGTANGPRADGTAAAHSSTSEQPETPPHSSSPRLPRLPGRLTARGCAPGHAPDGQDYDARTPAHLAACEGHAKVLELLLANGADPSLRDRRAAPRM